MFPILYRRTLDFAKPEGACPAGLRDCYNCNPWCNRGLCGSFGVQSPEGACPGIFRGQYKNFILAEKKR